MLNTSDYKASYHRKCIWTVLTSSWHKLHHELNWKCFEPYTSSLLIRKCMQQTVLSAVALWTLLTFSYTFLVLSWQRAALSMISHSRCQGIATGVTLSTIWPGNKWIKKTGNPSCSNVKLRPREAECCRVMCTWKWRQKMLRKLTMVSHGLETIDKMNWILICKFTLSFFFSGRNLSSYKNVHRDVFSFQPKISGLCL